MPKLINSDGLTAFERRHKQLQEKLLNGMSMTEIIEKEEKEKEEAKKRELEARKQAQANLNFEVSIDGYDKFEITPDNVSKFVKHLLKDNNISINNLANILGISTTPIHYWAKSDDDGKRNPSLKNISRIALALDLPLHEVIKMMQLGEKPPLLKTGTNRDKNLFSITDFNQNSVQKLADNLVKLSDEDRSEALRSILMAFNTAQTQSKLNNFHQNNNNR
jgi:transcriptional regulator with XRE-family HTH domain